MYLLSVLYVDDSLNEFIELGGGAWKTRKEQLLRWDSLPEAGGNTDFLVDKYDRTGCSLEDTKMVTRETVEKLLGEPIAALIARGRLEALQSLNPATGPFRQTGYYNRRATDAR